MWLLDAGEEHFIPRKWLGEKRKVKRAALGEA
jgi:hypothetical protein